ncbi:M15 family metallopeptidase [Vallitalea pronyensis]|uniref:M15 family metallopeptidase n=1 Tax=Vallitalea pronyensis TaxID=1348613 RepID=A0A8J8MNG8_9FIRM|nr:M15 family metallopeptidase [Vallitalea pronyensis]QUI24694.1 M15 family metallopeptidase [Vallitalea pronyensis]
MYNRNDKLTMLMGSIGLILVLAFGNVHEGLSQDVVNAYENVQLEEKMASKEAIQAFAYMDKPLAIQDIKVPREQLTLAAGSRYALEVTGLIDWDKQIDLTAHPDMMYTSSDENLAVVKNGHITILGTGITGDQVIITCTYQNISQDIHIRVKQSLADTVIVDKEGRSIITNYEAVDALVNKERGLPSDYVPSDLVEPDVPFSFSGDDEKRNMRKEAAIALEKMFDAAKEESLHLAAASGYRSYYRQKCLHHYKINQDGNKATQRISAEPGYSEHQTGLAMDITCRSVGLKLKEKFGQEPEGIWVEENAHRFGFIIRYPQDMEGVTGYKYEPWHLRYLGENLAKLVYDSGLTYEEFLETY